jgi:hypothetical protein
MSAVPSRRKSILASLGIVLAVLSWCAVTVAVFIAIVDVHYPSREEAAVQLAAKAKLISGVFVAGAVWISGYVFAEARIRAGITIVISAALFALVLGMYVVENWK